MSWHQAVLALRESPHLLSRSILQLLERKRVTVADCLLGRPTLATLESTAFLALGFGAVNGQDFRTRRDPLGRFTLFLISQLVSGSRVSLTQGRAGPAGVETAGREHGSCNHAVGE